MKLTVEIHYKNGESEMLDITYFSIENSWIEFDLPKIKRPPNGHLLNTVDIEMNEVEEIRLFPGR